MNVPAVHPGELWAQSADPRLDNNLLTGLVSSAGTRAVCPALADAPGAHRLLRD